MESNSITLTPQGISYWGHEVISFEEIVETPIIGQQVIDEYIKSIQQTLTQGLFEPYLRQHIYKPFVFSKKEHCNEDPPTA
jgi:hypothetical protein